MQSLINVRVFVYVCVGMCVLVYERSVLWGPSKALTQYCGPLCSDLSTDINTFKKWVKFEGLDFQLEARRCLGGNQVRNKLEHEVLLEEFAYVNT